MPNGSVEETKLTSSLNNLFPELVVRLGSEFD